jgi:hypothetical protein
MSDFSFTLFYSSLQYYIPGTTLTITFPFTYSGLKDFSLPTQPDASEIAWQLDSNGSVLAEDTGGLTFSTPALTLHPGTGNAPGWGFISTVATIPTLALNPAAIVIEVAITLSMDVIPGAVSPFFQPTYSDTVSIQDPVAGSDTETVPIRYSINNTAYSISLPNASQVIVNTSADYPPTTPASAGSSSLTAEERIDDRQIPFDITVNVPITITIPSTPTSPVVYLNFTFATTLSIIAN